MESRAFNSIIDRLKLDLLGILPLIEVYGADVVENGFNTIQFVLAILLVAASPIAFLCFRKKKRKTV